MEDMKGDMAGAACVVGLMHALASRKAKANVVGIIGLVENMPDGKAAAPGRHRDDAVGPDGRDHQHRRRRAASCWQTCCGTCRSASSRNSWSIWQR
jgi:leucyl aminopeptidase